MTTFNYIIMILVICVWGLLKHNSRDIPNFSSIAAAILLVIDVLFLIMLGGLYGGHIIFMTVYNKTTNEALKRSEKYGYNFKQYQLISSNNGLLQMLYNLYCRRVP